MNMVFEKTLAFTGHRPQKLHGYDYRAEGNRKMLIKLRALIARFIERRGVTTFVTGMALGIDMWSAQIVLQLKEKYPHIKLVCAIPCKNQFKKWNEKDREVWHSIVEQADYVYYVSENEYTAWCMEDRNRWMVDNSRFVIAVWDGTKGGTGNCVKYAKKRQRSTCYLNPHTLEVSI